MLLTTHALQAARPCRDMGVPISSRQCCIKAQCIVEIPLQYQNVIVAYRPEGGSCVEQPSGRLGIIGDCAFVGCCDDVVFDWLSNGGLDDDTLKLLRVSASERSCVDSLDLLDSRSIL